MKEIRYLLIMAICAIGLVACQDEDLAGIRQGVNTGKPVKVELKFGVPKSTQVEVTRAGKEGDNVVKDLYIFIFNSAGNLKTAYYDATGFTQEKTYRDITTTSGLSYIYAVANVANAPAEYNATNLKNTLDAAVSRTVGTVDKPFTKEELMALKVSYRNANVGIIDRLQSSFMMSGKFVPTSGDQGDGQCTIPEENGSLSGEIQLYRTDAEITFNVSIGDKVDKPQTNATITPSFELTSYRIVNLPRTTSVINNSTDWDNAYASTVPAEADYYEIAVADAQDDWDDQTDGSQQFTFYMMENRKDAKKDVTNYNDRELQQKQVNEDGTVTNGDWTYAPERGTYVVLRGIFRGYAHKGGTDNGTLVPVEGREVQYKIHLGNFSNNNWSNFQTNRNTSYTYKVTVNGVDNIVVEVETDEENQPGATGDIFFTNNTNIYQLDAHYETCLLRFTKSMLAGIQGAEPTYRVSTPFSISNEEDNPTYKSEDANWVRFAVNAKSGNNYNRNLRSYAEGCASNGTAGEASYRNGDLLTVDQLMAVLGELKDDGDSRWDNKGEFLVTCFVNEFYYTNDDEEAGYDADNVNGRQYAPPTGANVQSGVPLWKYCVNQPDRTLHLLCDIRSSADGESNIIEAAYVLSQRSIQTFYNTDPSITDLTSCMGLESVNETYVDSEDNMHMGTPVNNARDYRDGLTNTLYMWGFLTNVQENQLGTWQEPTQGWNHYIDFANNGYKDVNETTYVGMQDDYRSAYIACMQRNRDVNRDGKISEDEIKWYMPAINQLGAIYIGEGALSVESRLMPDNSSWEIAHYFSSTYASDTKASSAEHNQDDGYVLTAWAEEGFSISTADATEDWRNSTYQSHPVRYHYRCIRNVGNIKKSRGGQSYLNTTRRPQNYWTLNGHTVDFTYLNSNAIRQTAATEELAIHDQFNVQNRVYSKMEYSTTDAGMISATSAAGSTSPDICANSGTGWRIPNQRELMFLTLNGQNQRSGVEGLINDFPAQGWTDNEGYHSNWYRFYHSRTHFRWWTPTSTSTLYRSPFDGNIRYSFCLIGGAKDAGNSGNLSLLTNSYNSFNWGTQYYVRCVRDVE